MATMQAVDLFFQEGSSDKVYHIQLESLPTGNFVVNFQYGRRGSTLKSDTKTKTPVSLAEAESVYDKILKEKLTKGYKVSPGSPSLTGTSKPTTVHTASAVTASTPVIFIPQLLNPIDESEVERYLTDDAWGLQEKKDGEHQAVHKASGSLFLTNKKGKRLDAPSALENSVGMPQDLIVDAEAIGDTFHCFDLLENIGISLRGVSYGERYESLKKLFKDGALGGNLKLVPLAIGTKAKRKLYEELKGAGKEGVVFKRLDATFTSGKSHSDMVKCKFCSEASCIVAPGREGKMSIGLNLIDDKGKKVFVGNCTISGKGVQIPPVGSVVEIKYLYMYKGGSLYQPVYKGPRTDVDVSECLLSQVKYKAEED